MKFKSITIACGAVVALAGCATKPNEITPSYTSKLEYKDYSCSQMKEEAQRLSERSSDAYRLQKRQHSRDNTNVAVGILFAPVAFHFVEGDGPKAVEVARLKGQMDALEEASILQDLDGCRIKFKKR